MVKEREVHQPHQDASPGDARRLALLTLSRNWPRSRYRIGATIVRFPRIEQRAHLLATSEHLVEVDLYH